MKWMLIVMVFGKAPVETGLLYDNLSTCMKAEGEARMAYAGAYNALNEEWQKQSAATGYTDYKKAMQMNQDLLLRNQMTCVPHE